VIKAKRNDKKGVFWSLRPCLPHFLFRIRGL
jgi:hypothetical protein